MPIVPGRFLGFHHPSSEVHIESSDGSFVSCPGQDNPDKRCIVGDAQNVFEAQVTDHHGMYLPLSEFLQILIYRPRLSQAHMMV